jgi:hypothetical protein
MRVAEGRVKLYQFDVFFVLILELANLYAQFVIPRYQCHLQYLSVSYRHLIGILETFSTLLFSVSHRGLAMNSQIPPLQ